MIVRVSIPRRFSASACSSACSTTAPQNDHEYGTTMPTFTRRRIRLARQLERSRRLLERLRELALLRRRCRERDHVEERPALEHVLMDRKLPRRPADREPGVVPQSEA